MKSAAKKYFRDFSIGITLYLALLFATNSYLGSHDMARSLMIVIALLPMAGALLALRAMMVFVRSQDELQRKNIMDAVLISFVLTAFGTFAYGFLEGVGFPRMDTHYVFTFLVGGMGLAQLYTCWWRYR